MGVTEPVVLVNRAQSGTDVYGNPVYVETVESRRGWFNPGASTETVGGRRSVTTQPQVFLRGTVALDHVDAVEVRGTRYEVDGAPHTWNGRGVVIDLVRKDG